jgi:actin-related protein
MVEPDLPAVVVDNGSGFIKAGLAGEDSPKVLLPTIIGVPKMPGIMVGMDQKDYYVGAEAVEKARFLNSTQPIQLGQVENWEDMEKIWTHVFFQEMNVLPKEHRVVCTDAPLTSLANREKMAQIMFEVFEVPYFYMSIQSVFSLYASGRTTGVVVDSGYSVTSTVPIYEGFALPHGIMRLPIAGRDLNAFLLKTLQERGCTFPADNIDATITGIKQKYCYIASDFDTDIKKAADPNTLEDETYELPDGSLLSIGTERFRCPEALFQPGMIGKDFSGLADTTFQTIMKCDADIKRELYGNILLAGGTSMMRGLSDRLKKDVKALAPSSMNAEVYDPPERLYSAWLGGSILASLSSFRDMFVSKADYQNFGASIIYQKCF